MYCLLCVECGVYVVDCKMFGQVYYCLELVKCSIFVVVGKVQFDVVMFMFEEFLYGIYVDVVFGYCCYFVGS